MRISQTKLKKFQNNKTPIIITYRDITAETNSDKDKLKYCRLKDLYIRPKLYGIIGRFDEENIIIFGEESTSYCDWTIVPLSLIEEIIELKPKRR